MEGHQHRMGRRRIGRAGVVAVSLIAALGGLAGAAAAGPATGSQNSAAACSAPAIAGTLSLAGVTVVSASMDTSGSFTPPGSPVPITGLPAFCAVALTQTDSAGNLINIAVWLPATWNGRFEGVGGGGYSCGISYPAVAAGVESGYATASTDCGVPPADGLTGSWALTSANTLNWPLIDDFAFAGIHDMSVAGKAVTAGYYAHAAAYSYFNGCSTGGREGLMEAQRYPADYNGIVSGAPAINWTKFIPAEIWPELVMKQSNDFLPACKEQAFTEAVVKACGNQSGVTSPFIADPARCHWDPANLIGFSTPCGTITATDAHVMAQIWAGPTSTDGKKLWYGLEPGASLGGLAGTVTTNGVTSPSPFPITVSWLGSWLQLNPSWNWQTLTYAQFDQLFAQSVSEFSRTIATNNPDLAPFEQDGGKILIWHGMADQLIFPQGTINYYQRVREAMGGAKRTDSFARLFLAPGAQHCTSAAGPAPADPLTAIVNWVENGQAPRSILGTVVDPATNVVTLSRPLCAFPLTARYTGHGSTADASNFTCARQHD
jgi:feruloyl esterase